MRIRHFLSDGKEVKSVTNHVIKNCDEFYTALKAINDREKGVKHDKVV